MWKKTITSIALLLVLISYVYPQDRARLENWKIVEPASDLFAIDSLVDLNEKFSKPKDKVRTFGGEFDRRWFRVFSVDVKEASVLRIVADLVTINGKSFAIPRAIGERSSVSFVGRDSFRHHISAITSEKRVYLAHAITQENEMDREIGERFSSSLKLKSEKLASDSSLESDETAELAPPVEKRISGGIASSGGVGVDSQTISNGRGGIGAGSVLPTTASQDRRLRIISKPSPPYTDFARFYDIQGSVMLRVFFMADGTIGDVLVIDRLPLGLTANAIAAAKRMVFEPTVLNGKPMTTSKQVQYNFLIY